MCVFFPLPDLCLHAFGCWQHFELPRLAKGMLSANQNSMLDPQATSANPVNGTLGDAPQNDLTSHVKGIDVVQPGNARKMNGTCQRKGWRIWNNSKIQRQNQWPNGNPHTHLKHVLMMISFKLMTFNDLTRCSKQTKNCILLAVACMSYFEGHWWHHNSASCTGATDAVVEQDNITRAGAIAPLIALLDHHDLRELAAAVLAKLAHEHEDNQSATWRLIQLMHADWFGESAYGNANISHMIPCMECSPTFIIQVQCSEHRAHQDWIGLVNTSKLWSGVC